MGCRCTDITNCQQDIAALEKAKAYIQELKGLDTEIETDLTALGKACEEAFITDTMDSLVSGQKKMNDQVTTMLTTIQTKIETQVNQLKNTDLVQLQAEDKAEHEKETENEA